MMLVLRTRTAGVRPVGGDMPANVPRCTARCSVGAPRRGAPQPPPAPEVARFYLAPPPPRSPLRGQHVGSHQCTCLLRLHCGGGVGFRVRGSGAAARQRQRPRGLTMFQSPQARRRFAPHLRQSYELHTTIVENALSMRRTGHLQAFRLKLAYSVHSEYVR